MESLSNVAKNRRFLSRSDEEILDEIDARVDHRMGWPKPLPVLPLNLITIYDEAKYIPNLGEVREAIRNILDTQRIAWYDRFYLAYHHPFGTRPTESDITYIIQCRKENIPWIHALKEVRKYLSGRNIHYRVEFIDFEAANPRRFNILPGDPIVNLWSSYYKAKIINTIKDTAWQAVNVFHCGHGTKREHCPITVIISAWDAQQDVWWERLLPAIRAFWPMAVQLQGGQNLRGADLDVHSCARALRMSAFTGPLEMGCSVGMKGEPSGGTLGGALELEWADGSRMKFGITNHHVVLEGKIDSGKCGDFSQEIEKMNKRSN